MLFIMKNLVQPQRSVSIHETRTLNFNSKRGYKKMKLLKKSDNSSQLWNQCQITISFNYTQVDARNGYFVVV